MRMLFTTVPAYGHFHPLVPIAAAAQQAGHEVAFASAQSFAPSIKAAGFHVMPAGRDFIPPNSRRSPAPPPSGGPPLWAQYFIRLYAHAMTEDLINLARTWKPDVIVREGAEFGGCVAAEVLGIPHAVVSTGWLPSDYQRRLDAAPLLDELRVQHGLPSDPEVVMPFRYLFLAPMPERYWNPQRPLPPVTQFVRPVPFDRSGAEQLPAWVPSLPSDQPTVYVTLGTIMNQLPGVFESILDGLANEPVNVVATVGRDRDPAQLRGPGRPNVHVEQYIPQSLLLPHCDLVVAHCGFGTVMSALACGLPMVAMPFGADQPLHAERVRALGLGEVLQPADVQAQAVRAAAWQVLNNPLYAENTRRFRDEIEGMPGPEVAVRSIARLQS